MIGSKERGDQIKNKRELGCPREGTNRQKIAAAKSPKFKLCPSSPSSARLPAEQHIRISAAHRVGAVLEGEHALDGREETWKWICKTQGVLYCSTYSSGRTSWPTGSAWFPGRGASSGPQGRPPTVGLLL